MEVRGEGHLPSPVFFHSRQSSSHQKAPANHSGGNHPPKYQVTACNQHSHREDWNAEDGTGQRRGVVRIMLVIHVVDILLGVVLRDTPIHPFCLGWLLNPTEEGVRQEAPWRRRG